MTDMNAIYAALGEILKDERATTTEQIEAVKAMGPDGVQYRMHSNELLQLREGLNEYLHTHSNRKGSCTTRSEMKAFHKKALV
jgi:hypothetical protein